MVHGNPESTINIFPGPGKHVRDLFPLHKYKLGSRVSAHTHKHTHKKEIQTYNRHARRKSALFIFLAARVLRECDDKWKLAWDYNN